MTDSAALIDCPIDGHWRFYSWNDEKRKCLHASCSCSECHKNGSWQEAGTNYWENGTVHTQAEMLS